MMSIKDIKAMKPEIGWFGIGYDEKLSHYIRSCVQPYIESLPDIRVNMINEIGKIKEVTDTTWNENGRLEHNLVKRAKVTFHINGKVIIKNALVELSLESNEKPHITYKHLVEGFDDLCPMYDKYYSNTIHCVKLHLPFDYKF